MDLNYEIKRSSKRKKITIIVERDREVIVHAPQNTPEEKIHQVVDSKKAWIFAKIRHPQKYQELPHAPGKELVSGESALYLGRQYRIEIVPVNIAKEISFAQRFYIPEVEMDERQSLFKEWYKIRAREKMKPRVQFHAKNLGVEISKLKIVENRYRWGSCSIKDNINLNWRLIKAPMFVIDYIIVHELAHLLEPNHTPRFWNIVKTQITKMDQAKQWLKEHGQLLEQEL